MKKYYKVLFTTLILCLVAFIGIKAQPTYGWDTLSKGTSGATPYVRALAQSPINYFIYAGGNFTIAGRISASHIARWDDLNKRWDSLRKGTNGEVDALAFFNNNLYAGGKFDSAGGILAHHIASCDTGNHWDSVLGGLNGNVYALCVYHNALYAGGDFTMANGITSKRIAVWNGTSWDSVGAGFDSNTVYALAVYRDTLYAGGSFTKSAGQTVNYIAKWNGTKWLPVDGGMNNTVYALDSCSPWFNLGPIPRLYAGGAFTQAGGINANHIAMIDTVKWDSLGPGTNDTVRALNEGHGLMGVIQHNSRILDALDFLMVGGNFTKQGNVYSPYIAFWDGSAWDSVGYVNKPVYSLLGTQNNNAWSFIGGAFDSTFCNYWHCGTANPANHIAKLMVFLGGGFNELSNNSSISIYPNPSNGVFTLQVKSEKVKVKSTIEIYNMLGEKVFFSQISIPTTQISINQPSGVYLCRVVANDGAVIGSSKIIIK